MPEQNGQSGMQLVAAVTEVKTTLQHMSTDMSEIKRDLKEIREGAPLHRIEILEARWRAALTWLGALSLVVIGAIATTVLTR
ncbi:MAG: hypothetical protein ACRD0W_00215 [Acidimicrobiales bacterium]